MGLIITFVLGIFIGTEYGASIVFPVQAKYVVGAFFNHRINICLLGRIVFYQVSKLFIYKGVL